MRVLHGHRGPIRAVAFSHDGRLLASGGDDGDVVVWPDALQDGRRSLGVHRDCVRALAFSPDGAKLCSAGWDDTTRIWPLGQKREAKVQEGHLGGAWCVAYSPAGFLLASGAGDGTAFFHITRTKKTVSRREHRMPVTAIVFTPDGGTMITGSQDCRITFWDGAWNKPQGKLAIHNDWVRSLSVSPDGRLLASSDDEGVIVLTDVAAQVEVRRWHEHAGPVGQVAFTPRGDALLSVGWDGIARQWDLCGRQSAAYAWEAGRLLCLAVAPNGMTAAAGAESGDVVIWDLEE